MASQPKTRSPVSGRWWVLLWLGVITSTLAEESLSEEDEGITSLLDMEDELSWWLGVDEAAGLEGSLEGDDGLDGGVTELEGTDGLDGGVTELEGVDGLDGGVTELEGVDGLDGGVTELEGVDGLDGGVTELEGTDGLELEDSEDGVDGVTGGGVRFSS